MTVHACPSCRSVPHHGFLRCARWWTVLDFCLINVFFSEKRCHLRRKRWAFHQIFLRSVVFLEWSGVVRINEKVRNMFESLLNLTWSLCFPFVHRDSAAHAKVIIFAGASLFEVKDKCFFSTKDLCWRADSFFFFAKLCLLLRFIKTIFHEYLHLSWLLLCWQIPCYPCWNVNVEGRAF